jgi:hypothetical protein
MSGVKAKETRMKSTVLGAVTICAGVPLLPLGVGTATALADTTTPSTDTSDRAISFAGIVLVKTAAAPHLNLAIASDNSQAVAEGIGFGNLAIASNNSFDGAGGLLLNTAIADNNSQAISGLSLEIGGTAIARNGSNASSVGGHFNTVSVTNNSRATLRSESNNTVTASDGSTADISGNANTVTARCGGTAVFSAQSNQVTTSGSCGGMS